jgi:hypothetical protein
MLYIHLNLTYLPYKWGMCHALIRHRTYILRRIYVRTVRRNMFVCLQTPANTPHIPFGQIEEGQKCHILTLLPSLGEPDNFFEEQFFVLYDPGNL